MKNHRRAFTLLELMVVVGIMAFLGLASANGYNALKRGMQERGAVDAAIAILKTARERALIDRVPTAVVFWNRCIREATKDDNAIVVGEAVAVRRSGRITSVATSNNLLLDEFGDLNRSYGSYDTYKENERDKLRDRKGFRLWHMPDNDAIATLGYSIVADGVCYGYASGKSYSMWPGEMSGDDNFKDIVFGNDGMRIYRCAFYKINDGTFSAWKVGTAYGLEFQRLTLPDGFIFGTEIPKTAGKITRNIVILYKPDGNADGEPVGISYCKMGTDGWPTEPRTIGNASSSREAR